MKNEIIKKNQYEEDYTLLIETLELKLNIYIFLLKPFFDLY